MIKLNHLNYYRLPWNLTDNAISWLEPTAKCNLACDGCYRQNLNQHKSLEEIKNDIDVFKRIRNTDVVSIAGGDPLLHPDIVEVVKYVKSQRMKALINTNGIALTGELLGELKKAGVTGFTFHIDSKQGRPEWKNATELELNELRLKYADMVKYAGGMSCTFNSTVYEDTIQYVPAMLKWAEKYIDRVQVMVFILYRAVTKETVDYYLGSEKVDIHQLVYNEEFTERIDLKAEDVVEIIRTEYPDFDPCAYLNGTEKPDLFKWLLTGRIGSKGKIHGYMGAKCMEIIQTFHHIFFKTYLGYSKPANHRVGLALIPLTPFDKKLRKAFFNFYKNPLNLFLGLYYQTTLIIQPVDVLEDGRQSMCDGCPDMTVWNGQLVWSCRMEEQFKFGANVRTIPKNSIPKN